jgi:hypothetical protein
MFDAQLLAEPGVFCINFLHPNYLTVCLNLVQFWENKNRQEDHKRK